MFNRVFKRVNISRTFTGTTTGLFAVTLAVFISVMLAAWRMRHGLALVGDSGSYLAGASGFSQGRWFESPLVPSFSELPLLDTVNNGGWSPFADFGFGAPMIIAIFDVVLPLHTAAGLVNVVATGCIAAAIMFGPWTPQRAMEWWTRSLLAISVSCWPILRFTGVAVLSEPVFCAVILWIAVIVSRLGKRSTGTLRSPGSPRLTVLISLGVLTLIAGFTRFVGPIVAIVVAILLIQRGLSWRRASLWVMATGLVPSVVTALATGGTRTWTFHSRDSSDVFFLARGVGGWFEAGMGDQTDTLLRLSFQPSLLDWFISIASIAGAVWILWWWLRLGVTKTSASVDTEISPRSPLEPALVLGAALALAVVPSMFFLDAILKLENRIMMPTGLLIISAGGWWLARRSSRTMSPGSKSRGLISRGFISPSFISRGAVCLWAIVATQPWNWLERPAPSEPTRLTAAVDGLGAKYVVTNQADLVWWHTGVPARYLPSGFFDRSARSYDPEPIMTALPCALAINGGAVVVDTVAGLPSRIQEQLSADVAAGHYDEMEIEPGVFAYWPTGLNC